MSKNSRCNNCMEKSLNIAICITLYSSIPLCYLCDTVADPPTITSVEQVSPGTIRVSWNPPTKGAPVTGYKVYMSNNTQFQEYQTAGPTDTSSDLTIIISDNRTYNITVEAESEHLSGVSSATFMKTETEHTSGVPENTPAVSEHTPTVSGESNMNKTFHGESFNSHDVTVSNTGHKFDNFKNVHS